MFAGFRFLAMLALCGLDNRKEVVVFCYALLAIALKATKRNDNRINVMFLRRLGLDPQAGGADLTCGRESGA
jgi:hypothetical protein